MEESKLREFVSVYDAEQREDEVVWFYRHAEKINPRVVVEIGIKEGGNLKILSMLAPEDGLVVGIDPRKDTPEWIAGAHCQVELLRGLSMAPSVIEQLKTLLDGRPIDVLFIDGDHSTVGMLADFNVYGQLVRPGGIIAVHDIYYLKAVTRAWQHVPGENRFESEYNQSSIGIGFIIKGGE